MKKINLSNIHDFSIPLIESSLSNVFYQEGKLLFDSIEEQVIALRPEATKYLKDFISTQNYLIGELPRKQYFKDFKESVITDKTDKEIKKWLYHLGIPFSQKIYWSNGYILSWKMLVKFAPDILNHESLFQNDYELFFDASLNWLLRYESDYLDIFYFLKNRIQNADTHSKEMIAMNNLLSKSNNEF